MANKTCVHCACLHSLMGSCGGCVCFCGCACLHSCGCACLHSCGCACLHYVREFPLQHVQRFHVQLREQLVRVLDRQRLHGCYGGGWLSLESCEQQFFHGLDIIFCQSWTFCVLWGTFF